MAQKKKNSQQNDPNDKNYGKLVSTIIVVVLFLFYVLFSFKEFF